MSHSHSSEIVQCDTIIKADEIVTQDETRRIIQDGGIAILNGYICGVGTFAEIESSFSSTQKLDLSGKMVLPGLINAHTHLPMTLFRGMADDLPLMEWLEKHIWPVERQLTQELLKVGAQVGCAELIRTGCTAFLNGYFHEQVTGDIAESSGIRAVLGEGFFSFPSPMFATANDCWEQNRKLKEYFNNSDLVRTAVTPHAVFTVKPDELQGSFELAEQLQIPWQIHLAESAVETNQCLKRYGLRPVKLLDTLGLLCKRTVLHHCVDITDAEIELLAENDVCVVHNPVSNLKLCSGIAPIQKMLDVGITVGLGTDGASSNNQLNLFREMAFAALLGKIRHRDASAIGAQTVLDMATRNSAICLGWPELGQIAINHPADLVALDISSPNLLPMYSSVSHLAYAATGMEVSMTMVAGKILYRDGNFTTISIKDLNNEVLEAKKWILRMIDTQKKSKKT